MVLSNWLCASSARTSVVRLVHAGGRVELHEHSLLAAEVMQDNPRCCVARPDVFKDPWTGVLSPDTVLVPGQKFYVLPASTLRKLQRAQEQGARRAAHGRRASSSPRPPLSPASPLSRRSDGFLRMVPGNKGELPAVKERCCGVLGAAGRKVNPRELSAYADCEGSPYRLGEKGSPVAVTRGNGGGTPRGSPLRYWQPGLESISEE